MRRSLAAIWPRSAPATSTNGPDGCAPSHRTEPRAPVSAADRSVAAPHHAQAVQPVDHTRRVRRQWRKVHLAMDTSTSDIRAVEFTSGSDGDSPVLSELLDQIPERLIQN